MFRSQCVSAYSRILQLCINFEMCAYIYMHILYEAMYMCLYTHISKLIHSCQIELESLFDIYIYIYMCVYVYVYIYIIYTSLLRVYIESLFDRCVCVCIQWIYPICVQGVPRSLLQGITLLGQEAKVTQYGSKMIFGFSL